MDDPRLAELRIPSVRTAAETARRWLEAIAVPLPEDRLDDLKFCANELVINSIIHGGKQADIVLTVEVGRDSVRVVVTDEGRRGRRPVLREAGLEDTSGRGLRLVQAIADRWGVHREGLTSVWFEIDRPAPIKPRLAPRNRYRTPATGRLSSS
jgi:anti-sigma regulatory factor (Ser/Thr protein kinase)